MYAEDDAAARVEVRSYRNWHDWDLMEVTKVEVVDPRPLEEG